MGEIKERMKRGAALAAAGTLGVLAVEHLLWPAITGNDNLETTLSSRVDSVAVGQPFNHDSPKQPGKGLRIETIKAPSASAIDAAWYNAYENSGANDPTKPSERLRAAEACATLILNGGELTNVERDAWSTAQRNNGQGGNHDLADQQFTRAADECTADIMGMLGGRHPAEQIVVPVAN